MIAGKATATVTATSALTATAADKRKQQAARLLCACVCVCAITKCMWDNRLDNELVAQWRASIVLRSGETLRLLLRLRHWRSSRAKRSQSKGLERRHTNSGDSEFDQITLTTATLRRVVTSTVTATAVSENNTRFTHITPHSACPLSSSFSQPALPLSSTPSPACSPSLSLLLGELLLCTLRRKQVELQAVNKPKA